MITFGSLRLLALILHFLLTTFLIWTRFPSIGVSLSKDASNSDFSEAEDSYLSLISFGIILLVIEFLMLPFNYHKVTFRGAIAMAMDFSASFFIAWIVLDGLCWQTYIYIFAFCVIMPAVWEMLFVLPIAYMRLWDVIVQLSQKLYKFCLDGFRFLGGCISYFFDDCFNEMDAAYNRAAEGS